MFSCETAKMAKILIQNGADENARESLGFTPLHYMGVRGRFMGVDSVARVHIAYGALLEARTLTDGSTPLHVAVKHGSTGVGSVLIESGVNL